MAAAMQLAQVACCNGHAMALPQLRQTRMISHSASVARSAALRPAQPQRACQRAMRSSVAMRSAAVAEAPAASAANDDDEEDNAARPVFPFTAIVGQEQMKLALLLNIIDPKIGGVMVMGDRGTGKSTTVRALTDLLPKIQVVAGDPFNSDPVDQESMSDDVRQRVRAGEQLEVKATRINMVDLPLGATEDRVCGTIDIEKALTEGVKAFEPGLLAKANRGVLYVDEVNLLDDHLVDVLLDSAASGWNTVEREGISISHPARFILVGSGNPEEGELRPQLLDRFGMHAEIRTVKDPSLRVQIVEQRAEFDADPAAFRSSYGATQQELTNKITAARKLLKEVKLDYEDRVKISEICSELDVDGLRGDMVTNRAAKALAAFEGRTQVTQEDIFKVMPLCLRHRLRKDPLEQIDSGEKVQDTFKRLYGF
mmetsp:Transcript_14493/g.43822  ORF Transcript_14493/g.43822 Transcript_14493/m.43822 type:complete len:426 (+) Transcript_14493:144-1421(+)|eukprot:CAMPEP_0206136430 /NCGR_PEP_ID=MMETSP1473-20131121/1667_1 /ASSEMBLY_ACC=CAM_ASM_001109 /TAXON_ID=1461547 /ORGANISM="Stichococcus sp, Strain RCC1054" /LENGTH=425 /DNA_ID=CAMNT_0053528965 /DNA_START=88 /DNA_END=1365 /DNA_ORIENTATION=-